MVGVLTKKDLKEGLTEQDKCFDEKICVVLEVMDEGFEEMIRELVELKNMVHDIQETLEAFLRRPMVTDIFEYKQK